jgi:hypothetical protein
MGYASIFKTWHAGFTWCTVGYPTLSADERDYTSVGEECFLLAETGSSEDLDVETWPACASY